MVVYALRCLTTGKDDITKLSRTSKQEPKNISMMSGKSLKLGGGNLGPTGEEAIANLYL